MTDYYVTDTGSDSNNGLTTSTAFLTIQHAISVASNYDTINTSGTFNVSTTIVVDKPLTIINYYLGTFINKTTVGDLFLLQSSDITMAYLTLTQNTSNLADFLINIDRGSSGFTPPIDYTNINIFSCTFNMWKYGICLNGVNQKITSCNFLRQSGSTERLTCIICYYINGCLIDSNKVNDTLRMQRFLYLTSAGTAGSPYLNDINSKTGLITATNNTCSCSSNVQGFQFIIQDSFIGSSLSYTISENRLYDSLVATKLFIAYISSSTDLATISNISTFNNWQSLTQSGAAIIDSPSGVTVPVTQVFNSYNNTSSNFTLRADYTGNINFTQNATYVSPANLYNSGIVAYSAYGGGDPHIMDVFGNKTTLPNDWYKFILYQSSDILVIAKAQFIGNWLINRDIHYLVGNDIKTIDIFKNLWVTNFTYITSIKIIKDEKELVIDTIRGFIKSNNSSINYKETNTSNELISLTHSIVYPAKNLISYEIDLEPDTLVISIDNFWDDINSVKLLPKSSIGTKKGELIKHCDSNRIS